MRSREDLPYVALALLVWLPALLAVYPPQPVGHYVYFGFQFTRPYVIVTSFSAFMVGFVVLVVYRSYQHLTAISESTPAVREDEETN